MVMNIFLPALTFNVLVYAPLSWDLAAVPLISIVTALASLGISWLVYARFFRGRMELRTAGALILAATFCNATYLGLPVVQAVVGQQYARVPILFDLLGMSVVLFTIGTVVCVEYGTKGERHTFWEGILQALKLPPLLAAIIALIVNISGYAIPDFLSLATDTAGKVVAPAMLFSIGLALKVPKPSMLPQIAPALLIKLVVAPVIGWFLVNWLISDGPTAQATLLEAAMPTMVLTIVFAERYGLDEEILAQAILFSTVLSMATLPFVASL